MIGEFEGLLGWKVQIGCGGDLVRLVLWEVAFYYVLVRKCDDGMFWEKLAMDLLDRPVFHL